MSVSAMLNLQDLILSHPAKKYEVLLLQLFSLKNPRLEIVICLINLVFTL